MYIDEEKTLYCFYTVVRKDLYSENVEFCKKNNVGVNVEENDDSNFIKVKITFKDQDKEKKIYNDLIEYNKELMSKRPGSNEWQS